MHCSFLKGAKETALFKQNIIENTEKRENQETNLISRYKDPIYTGYKWHFNYIIGLTHIGMGNTCSYPNTPLCAIQIEASLVASSKTLLSNKNPVEKKSWLNGKSKQLWCFSLAHKKPCWVTKNPMEKNIDQREKELNISSQLET